MKVIDVMTGTPFYCSPNTNLGSAAELLWNQNCGILPIVDDQKVVGGSPTATCSLPWVRGIGFPGISPSAR